MNKEKKKIMRLILVFLLTCLIFIKIDLKAKIKKPQKMKIASLTSTQNSILVKYKKVKGIKKYQIAYRKKARKKWTIKNTKKTAYKLKKLLSNTKYEVKVRAYNGKWGKWSNIKTKKTLKVVKTSKQKPVSPTPAAGTTPTTGTTPITSNRVASPALVKLTDLISIKEKPVSVSLPEDNYGNKYDYAITNDQGYTGSSDPVTYRYLVNSAYGRIKGCLYIPKGAKSQKTSSLMIIGDGHVLYSSPAMNKVSKPICFDVNIAGIDDLIIQWVNNSTYSNLSDMECCLADAYLYPATTNDTAVIKSQFPIPMISLASIEAEPRHTGDTVDNYGNLYSDAVYNSIYYDDPKNNAVFEYLLNAKYRQFTGTLYVPQNSNYEGKTIKISVYGDGKMLYQSPEMNETSRAVNFSVDISGYNDVEIRFSGHAYSGAKDRLCLAYAYFYE